MSSPLPLSRSQIEKLGKRLVASERPAREDLLLLNELQMGYQGVLAAAVERVASVVPYSPTSRVKTQGTTLDKLRLNGGSWLSSIQDLAGMRLVGDFGRPVQDQLVAKVAEAFTNEPKPPKVIDRRLIPSSGYRAVHVVVFPRGVPVEVQVRTLWQHEWADLYEKLGDRLGRGIRYGRPPELRALPGETPDLHALRAGTVGLAVGYAESVSRLIDAYERLGLETLDAESATELREHLDALAAVTEWL